MEDFQELYDIIRRLRAPGGCPWDREQTVQTLAPHLIEEAHEAADAVASGDTGRMREELGDLMMALLLTLRTAEEDGLFSQAETGEEAVAKLVRRHPHVFGDVQADGADEVLANWEEIKKQERREKGNVAGVLGGVPAELPALLRARRIGDKAARVGFEWPDLDGPRDKVHEELAELEEVLADFDGKPDARTIALLTHELGDLLFAVVHLGRHVGVDAEMALRGTIERFTRRFRLVEERLGEDLEGASLEQMDRIWDEAKALEATSPAKEVT